MASPCAFVVVSYTTSLSCGSVCYRKSSRNSVGFIEDVYGLSEDGLLFVYKVSIECLYCVNRVSLGRL